MSEAAGDPLRDASREELMSALFAHVVMQNTNMALMFLGKAPNPQTGERMHDMEAAKLFIDQLEMLEVKTKGNLSREEEKLLQQSLMHLRMTFVQVVENPPKTEPTKAETPAPEASAEQKPAEPKDSSESEPQKRFSKKF
jgi:hypothetical protein